MSMMRSKYDANGTPSGVPAKKVKEVDRASMKKSVKSEGSAMSGRMAASFGRKEADEATRKTQSGCMH